MQKYTCTHCHKKTNEVKNCFGTQFCYKCYAEKLENEVFQMKFDLNNFREQMYFYSLLDAQNPNAWKILHEIGCNLQKIFDKYLPPKQAAKTIKE